jgi:catechol 2,3-dioxygenase-like lactoylglutathione lyase family enzyme
VPLEIAGICPLLSVFDMPKSIHFYRDLLGFEIVGTGRAFRGNRDDTGWCWLRLNGAELMLNSAYDPEDQPAMPAEQQFTNHGDVCLYFGCPDPDAAYAYLKEKGIDAKEPKIANYGMKQLYFSDPDGYGLCFQCKAEGARD